MTRILRMPTLVAATVLLALVVVGVLLPSVTATPIPIASPAPSTVASLPASEAEVVGIAGGSKSGCSSGNWSATVALTQHGHVVVAERVTASHPRYTLRARPGVYYFMTSEFRGASIRVRLNAGQIHPATFWGPLFCEL